MSATDHLAQAPETGKLLLSDRERRRAVTKVPVPEPGRYLAVESGDEAVLIPIESAVTHLGRSPSSDVKLDDPTVSRRHALVVLRGDEVVVLDDRSMNGTWVNGERVRESPLSDGDVVELGAVRVRFIDVPA